MPRRMHVIKLGLTKCFSSTVVRNPWINWAYLASLVLGLMSGVIGVYYFRATMRSPREPRGQFPIDFFSDNISSHLPAHLSNEITVVTSYIDIGSYRTFVPFRLRSRNDFIQWMQVFSRIENPVIAFLEEEKYISMFRQLRSHLPENRTKIYKISRHTLWAFSLHRRIKQIFSQFLYPIHSPETVVSEYCCIMHAKYEFMAMTLKNNPFHTKYFAWLDIGLFRAISLESKPQFLLHFPPQFEETKIAYDMIIPFEDLPGERAIFYDAYSWLCGCFFLGRYDVMSLWVQEYIRATEHYLDIDLAASDQQVLAAMFVGPNKPRTQIQTYATNGTDYWFHLGYLCKDAGDKVLQKRFTVKNH